VVHSLNRPLAMDSAFMHWTKDGSYAYNITYSKDGVQSMATATITSKGQTTIPKEVRAAANLKPGDRIHFAVLEDGTIIVRVKNRSIRDIAFKPPGGKRVSIAQMNR
jgi:antitoxin PrlF